MTQIAVTTHGLESVIAQFNGMPKQVDAARRSAIRKTTTWIATQGRREIAKEVGVAQKAIKRRITQRVTSKHGLIWFGLNRFDANLAGSPKQNKSGVKVRKYGFPGAFMASIYSPETKIWIRRSSKRYDAEIYPYKSRGGLYGHAGDDFRGRFPVVKATIAMDTPAVRAIIAAQAAKAGTRMREILAQELNYQINVKGAR